MICPSHTSSSRGVLHWLALAHARLAHKGEVLAPAHEVADGKGFDLDTADGRVEAPVELRQRLEIAEVGLLDAAFDTALAPQSGLIGEQAMEEVEVRQPGVLGVLRGSVELVGGHRDAQGSEVGEKVTTWSDS